MQQETMLGGYRVLDLTEGGYLLAGTQLAELGADVIKIEPPGGSPSRNRGPFYKDIPDPEKSLFWFAYNVNKRGITLDIEKADGREIFKRLVKGTDIVLESFPPGYMNSLGLGYSSLCEVNPDIILTSISPYGQEGPKAHYKAHDLTLWASGTLFFASGDPDRPPTAVSYPQAELDGGLRGVGASLAALWHREMTGEGQHVDVPIQQELVWMDVQIVGYWECLKYMIKRQGPGLSTPWAFLRWIWPCKDGYVQAGVAGGAGAGIADSTTRLVEWMDEEGMAPEWMVNTNWFFDFDIVKMTQEDVDRINVAPSKFFLTKTKAELGEEALKRQLIACPVHDIKDIGDDVQLTARNYWVQVEHPELGDTLTYCGPFGNLSEAPCRIVRRPPLIGEHNEELYEGDLGLSRQELILLKHAGVI